MDGRNGSDIANTVMDSPVEDGHGWLSEKRQMAEEFNAQRARMKELFLQKEEEVRRAMSERQALQSEVAGLRAQLEQLEILANNQKSEIVTLQMLVHETVEASGSACAGEVRALQTRCLELEQQLNLLSKQQASQDVSLAPSVLVQAVTKSIARKLGADTGHESLDDSMKKVNKYAQEDVEVLKSVVEPLEEEIKALKTKLRDTDTQLQVATQANKRLGQNTDTKDGASGETACDMCANYEAQLVAEQGKQDAAERRATHAEKALKLATEELEQAASVHADTLTSWQTERESTTSRLTALTERVGESEKALQIATETAAAAQAHALHRVTELTVHRQTLQDTLRSLEQENEMLVGKYTKKAEELENEAIDLPDDLKECQEYALCIREQLITACVGRERALAAEEGLRNELLNQAAVATHLHARHATLMQQYQQACQTIESMKTEQEQMKALGDKLRDSETRLQEAHADKKKLQQEMMEVRGRVSALQQDLDNSEKVQQDFVRLSQSLQVQLERIREADTEVRWQHDDDVNECPTCRTQLPHRKLKVHCRHCGRIFCSSCVSHTVGAGPRKAPARVCSVCHTLLERHTAPYFSTEAPQRPD